jgi:hypothetical protein
MLYCLSNVAERLHYGTTMYLDVSLSALMISQRGTTQVGRFMSHLVTQAVQALRTLFGVVATV